MIDIITDKYKWQEVLLLVENYDFYHTYHYHHISKDTEENPILIVYKESSILIAIPLLIRKIFDTDYFDATSVYGYPGPIQKNISKSFNSTKFLDELNQFFIEKKIISVFSRLNPFINYQSDILNGLGKINTLSNIVNIDITKDLDTQRAVYSKSTKNRINKVRKQCNIKTSKSKDDISKFIELYYENMKRVNATDYYYFSKDYFHEIINSNSFNTEVFFITHNETGEIACAAMMIKTNNIIQYHLSATKTNYVNLSPIRVLIDEMRIKGTNENFKYFNLGGGLGNKEDELFKFKSSFSKDFKPFKVWKHIVDSNIYNSLVQEKNIGVDIDFFPKYRYEINNTENSKENTSKNHQIEVIKEKKQWDALLNEFEFYDFYHTYDYHYISKPANETPVILKYSENDILIALPLLIRNIENTNYKDATSVYGYAGPLAKGNLDAFDNVNFREALNNYLKENNIISVFSRLNPYIPYQYHVLNHLGGVMPKGKVVNIDLALDKITQRQRYQSRLKTHINKSRRHCYIKKASNSKDFQDFIEIYKENMDRVKAKKSYYFNEDYFEKLSSSKDFETETLLAIHKESEKVIAGCMFIKTNNIVQYHLSGTRQDYLHLTPSKLLIDEMRLAANNQDYTIFNLGGGLGGSHEDSLFKFKSSFSKDFKDFNLWKYIVNKEAYEHLSKNKAQDCLFFPLYRS